MNGFCRSDPSELNSDPPTSVFDEETSFEFMAGIHETFYDNFGIKTTMGVLYVK